MQTSVNIEKVHSCCYYTKRSHISHFQNLKTESCEIQQFCFSSRNIPRVPSRSDSRTRIPVSKVHTSDEPIVRLSFLSRHHHDEDTKRKHFDGLRRYLISYLCVCVRVCGDDIRRIEGNTTYTNYTSTWSVQGKERRSHDLEYRNTRSGHIHHRDRT